MQLLPHARLCENWKRPRSRKEAVAFNNLTKAPSKNYKLNLMWFMSPNAPMKCFILSHWLEALASFNRRDSDIITNLTSYSVSYKVSGESSYLSHLQCFCKCYQMLCFLVSNPFPQLKMHRWSFAVHSKCVHRILHGFVLFTMGLLAYWSTHSFFTRKWNLRANRIHKRWTRELLTGFICWLQPLKVQCSRPVQMSKAYKMLNLWAVCCCRQ